MTRRAALSRAEVLAALSPGERLSAREVAHRTGRHHVAGVMHLLAELVTGGDLERETTLGGIVYHLADPAGRLIGARGEARRYAGDGRGLIHWLLHLSAADARQPHFALRLERSAAQAPLALVLEHLDPSAPPSLTAPGQWVTLGGPQLRFTFGAPVPDALELTAGAAQWLVDGRRWPLTTGNHDEQRAWTRDLQQALMRLKAGPAWPLTAAPPAQAGSDLPGEPG